MQPQLTWFEAINTLNQQQQAYVLVTLLGTSGSTPRHTGTKMVIAADVAYGSIGGGHLEYKVIAEARNVLQQANPQPAQCLKHFQLSASLGQCCGGETSVLLEYFPASGINIMLFGAGHVGRALVTILQDLPCQVQWVDSREQEFPHQYLAGKGNVTAIVTDEPEAEIQLMPANSYYLIMTHNHQLDFDLCRQLLKRQDFAYLGLIASQTKWNRFRQKFKQFEINPELYQRIKSPVGLEQVKGKLPMEVAVSIAGELIQHYQQHQPQHDASKGISRKALSSLLQP